MNLVLTVKDSDRIDKKFVYWFFLTVLCLYFQFVPYVNYFFVCVTFLFVAFCFYKKWPSGLIPILVLSFLHGEQSVSLYTLKVSGVSVFYILIISVFTLKVFTRKRIYKVELLFTVFFLLYFSYSIINGNFNETSYFINDTIFFVIGIFFLFSIYDFEKFDIEKMFFAMSLGYFFSKLLVLFSGLGLQVTAYSHNIDQYSAIFDPIENLLLIFNLRSFLSKESKKIRTLSLINISLFFVSAYFLGYVHGATIVLILIVLIYSILLNLGLLLFVSISCFFLLFVNISFDINTLLNFDEESVFLFKVQKVLGLFDFFLNSDFTIYDLPRSTQVRLIETANLSGQPPFFLIFGNGFGGYLTETLYFYGDYLNSDDYSMDQINSGKYQMLHAYNQIVLKHGLLSIFIAFIFFWRFRKLEDRNFRDTALIFLLLSYSFTIKPYLILALLGFSLKQRKILNVQT